MTQRREKKEKVIHTRISETLEQELKARASGLGVSVSNLVRNVLLSTFGSREHLDRDGAAHHERARADIDTFGANLAGEVSGRLRTGAAAATGLADEAAEPVPLGMLVATVAQVPSQDLLGWQTFLLAVNTVCEDCNAILPRGSDAAIGVTARASGARPVVCLPCLGELRGAVASS